MLWKLCCYPKNLLFLIWREYTVRFYEDLTDGLN